MPAWAWLTVRRRQRDLGPPDKLARCVSFTDQRLKLGTVIGANGRIDLATWAWGQAIVTASQLMTHYANEYHDLEHDRANPTATPWSGGSRVLPDGRLSPDTDRTMGTVFGGLALLLTALLVAVVRPAPLAVGLILVGMVLAWLFWEDRLGLK